MPGSLMSVAPQGRVTRLRAARWVLPGLLIALGVALAVPSGVSAQSPDGEELEALGITPDTEAPNPDIPVFPPDDPPVFAHYYIWFQPSSWNRAKVDYPLLGRYDSDDPEVMRRHIELAKAAGIDGFIVSWKSTEVLDARLDTLVDLAEEMDFKLAVTYQALDFNRDPLPVQRIAEDLDHFIQRWGRRSAFDLFRRPLVCWTGTEQYDVEELGRVISPRRENLLFLSTEKSVDGYQRVADVVEGNLYYWSSVDTTTFGGYPQKLIDMGDAVRARGGVWIAPVAPGFDARLVGGTSVVERRDGQTLRDEWAGAVQSSPTMIGVISWNEFTENTHIEPSQQYGSSALEVLADLTQAPRFTALDFDSSAPQGPPAAAGPRIVLLVALTIMLLGTMVLVGVRSHLGTDVGAADAGGAADPPSDP